MSQALHRISRFGLVATGMARARMSRSAGEREKHLRGVVNQLGLLHGLPQKLGQILAFTELEASSQLFTPLTEGAAALSTAEVEAILERETGRPVREMFRSIEPAGVAASIGQVHRAVLRDGRSVAVKVQYPGIAKAVETDLKALGWLSAPLGDLRRGFDVKAYRHEIGSMLKEELDYRSEAAAMEDFAERTNGWPHLTLPRVVQECSGERVLTMTWLEGEKLTSVSAWSEKDRHCLARTMVQLFLTGTFVWGAVHADPHPGNYRFMTGEGGPQLGLLDFGCVKRLDPALASGLLGLVEEVRQGGSDPEVYWSRYIKMGFNPVTLAPLKNRLSALSRLLLEPLNCEGPFDARRWNLGPRVSQLLGADRMAFRWAGPPGMIFFLRAAQGLIRYLVHFGVPVTWELPETAGRQGPRVTGIVNSTPIAKEGQIMKASALHIRVTEANETRVALTFDVSATDHLADLVPMELKAQLRERSINLAAISQEARQGDYTPGELFRWEEGRREVRVWLA